MSPRRRRGRIGRLLQARPIRRFRRFLSLRVVYPLLGAIARVWVRTMDATVRYDRRGPLFEYFKEGRPCIVALWHQDAPPLMYELFHYTPHRHTYFMVSHSWLGSLGAHFVGIWGIEAVKGSRSRRGVEAVQELARRVRERPGNVFVMADASRGPGRRARWGAIHLARETGLPIIGVRAWGSHIWVVKRTWMKLAMPPPWGRYVFLSAEPLTVEAEADDKDALEGYRLELEKRLNEMADAAEAYFTVGPEAVARYGPPVPGRLR